MSFWTPPSLSNLTSKPSPNPLSSTLNISPDSGHLSLTPQLRPSFTPSSPPVWTTAMESCLGYLTKPWLGSNMCRTQLPGFSRVTSPGSTSPPPSFTFTGFKSSFAFNTNSSPSPTNHSTVLPPSNCPTSSTPIPRLESYYPQIWLCSPSPTPACELSVTALGVAAPTLWNSLPAEIHKAPSRNTYKKLLKTHLFTKAYGL